MLLFPPFFLIVLSTLSRYILSIEKAEEIEEYVGDLLQGTDGKKGQFIKELLIRWRKAQRKSTDNANNLFVLTESVLSAGKDSSRLSPSFHSLPERYPLYMPTNIHIVCFLM